jgi:hypothetical protein
MPTEQFKQAVEKELTGKETERGRTCLDLKVVLEFDGRSSKVPVAHPELKQDRDLGRKNLGITIVLL